MAVVLSQRFKQTARYTVLPSCKEETQNYLLLDHGKCNRTIYSVSPKQRGAIDTLVFSSICGNGMKFSVLFTTLWNVHQLILYVPGLGDLERKTRETLCTYMNLLWDRWQNITGWVWATPRWLSRNTRLVRDGGMYLAMHGISVPRTVALLGYRALQDI